MSHWPQISFVYDGSFAGFLCCVAYSFQDRAYPFYFFTEDEAAKQSLYPLHRIRSDATLARRTYAALNAKLSPKAKQLVEYAFLTCLPRRERHIFDFIYANIYGGAQRDPADERVHMLTSAVAQLMREASELLATLRFADYKGLLVAELRPKNQVLPLLRPQVCGRFEGQDFLICDWTHRQALCCAGGRWQFLPLGALPSGSAPARALAMQALWKQFYHSSSMRTEAHPKQQHTQLRETHYAPSGTAPGKRSAPACIASMV